LNQEEALKGALHERTVLRLAASIAVTWSAVSASWMWDCRTCGSAPRCGGQVYRLCTNLVKAGGTARRPTRSAA